MLDEANSAKVIDSAGYDALTRSACFVCRIVQGQPLVPNPRILFEDDRVIAFLNQFPSQVGYTLVCPKRHVERLEIDVAPDEWLHLQKVVQRVAAAVADVTGAIRMYVASLGSPERNAHLHIHVCPCPPGTPFDQQQFVAMAPGTGRYLALSDDRADGIAARIRAALAKTIDREIGDSATPDP
jgi:diadenosine tetraphosphate (Ap4A) HIT family hydrolase